MIIPLEIPISNLKINLSNLNFYKKIIKNDKYLYHKNRNK
jgi:hypothetical protein